MNKVISINIGGSIFQVEENAYDKLNGYLNELKKYFSNKPEGNEIITDIENRIAELLRARITTSKAAIDIDDVTEVTSSMGAPKDFAIEEEKGENPSDENNTEKKSVFTMNETATNRVFRDPDARIVGGVCSGLGHYFKIDPIWIRLFFVIVTITFLKVIFFGASPVLVYIILWIIIPEAKTTAEKLQMRKEKINIDNIQKSVQTEFNKMKDTMQNKDFQMRATGFARRLADFIKQLVSDVVNIGRIVFKGFLFFFAIIFFIAAIGSLTGKLSIDEKGFSGFNFFNFFENNTDKVTVQAAIFIGLIGIGFICILFANALSRNKFSPKTNFAIRTTTIVLCISGIILAIISTVKVASYFACNENIDKIITLDNAQHHYYIKSLKEENYHSLPFFVSGGTMRVDDIEVFIEPTNGQSEIIMMASAFGQNTELAKINAASIISALSASDSIIIIPNSFTLTNNQVYRKQELKIKIKLHTGTKLTVEDDYWKGLQIKQNDDYRMASPGNTYMVSQDGIECDDCTKTYSHGSISTSGYPLNLRLSGSDFQKLKVGSGINVKIIQGNTYMIKARGTSNEKDIDLDFDDDRLSISDNRGWGFNMVRKNIIEVLVVMPDLAELGISGSGRVQLDGFQEDEIKIEMSGASNCEANIKTNKLIIEQTGATKLTLNGEIKTCEAEISGASKLYASSCVIKVAEIDVSGASYAELDVQDKLDANASGASSIKYKGEAKDIRAKNSGASSVEKMD